MRHGVGLSTSSDSELITQLLALTPPMEELDAADWVARSVLTLDAELIFICLHNFNVICFDFLL